jgi:hypothetical protein
LYHRKCSSLFVRVGVSVGVRTTERLRGSTLTHLSEFRTRHAA